MTRTRRRNSSKNRRLAKNTSCRGLNLPCELFLRWFCHLPFVLPVAHILLKDHVADKLDPVLFPYVKDAPSATPLSPKSPPPQTTSLRSQKPAWHRAPKVATVADNRQRIIVFVAGGMTYSEMREIYQLSNSLQKDIYIGRLNQTT